MPDEAGYEVAGTVRTEHRVAVVCLHHHVCVEAGADPERDGVLAGVVAPGTLTAVRGNLSHDESGILLFQGVVVKTVLVERLLAVVGHKHICLGKELVEGCHAIWFGDIKRYAALARVQVIIERVAILRGRHPHGGGIEPEGVAGLLFNFYYFRTPTAR